MNKKITLLDGAMGTNLIGLGFTPPFEQLNISHPEIIKQIHEKFIQAGSGAILTNTFSAKSLDVCESVWKIIRDLDTKKYISIGPDADSDLLVSFFQNKAHDLVFETIYEVKLAKELIEKFSQLNPIFSFCLNPKDFKTTLDFLKSYPVKRVGLNCLDGFNHLDELLSLIPSHYEIYLKPNTGKENLSPRDFAEKMKALIQKYNICYVGGCCGTTPQHITQLAAI